MFEELSIPGTPLQGPHKIVGDKVEKAVIFLHGYGADGNDLISLSDVLSQGMDNTLFVSPHAPEPCEMAPTGRQWYSIESLDPDRLGIGAEHARPSVDTFIDAVLAHYNLKPENVLLIGFSQGCMMALYTAYQREQAVGGIVGLSGALPSPKAFGEKVKSKPPVSLVHGTVDPVVPFSSLAAAATALADAGVEVMTHALPDLAHGIDNRAMNTTYHMMRRVLG